mgnify:FL=1
MAIVTSAGFWSDSYTPKVNRSPKLRQLERMRQPLAARKDAELLIENIGVAVGQTASVTVKQVKHNEAPGTFPNQGVVETRTVISRATVAADETSQEARLATNFSRPTYAADLSGNGGGSKLQAS